MLKFSISAMVESLIDAQSDAKLPPEKSAVLSLSIDPPKFEKEIDPMKERVTKIIRSSGYSARTFETAPLKKPHNLVEIFPKITDKRTSLNTRV